MLTGRSSWIGETIFTRKSEEDHQAIESAAARSRNYNQDNEPGTLRKFRKPGSVWEAHSSSLSMAPSSTSIVCNHECSSTSLAKYVLRPSVGEKHAHSTSPAADPLGKVLHHGFEGNRVWGEDRTSTAEEEVEERHLQDDVSGQ